MYLQLVKATAAVATEFARFDSDDDYRSEELLDCWNDTCKSSLPAIVTVATEILAQFKLMLEDCGPCDHSVGICACLWIRLADELEDALKGEEMSDNVDQEKEYQRLCTERDHWFERNALAEHHLAIAVGALKAIRDSRYDHACRWCSAPPEISRKALQEIEGK